MDDTHLFPRGTIKWESGQRTIYQLVVINIMLSILLLPNLKLTFLRNASNPKSRNAPVIILS